MRNQRPLTDDEKAELDALNEAVTNAIETRSRWLDAKMVETSCLQVGDGIYDLDTGSRVGTVTRLYRVSAKNHNGIYDTSVSCYYEYEKAPRSFDNTSRQTGRRLGPKPALVERLLNTFITSLVDDR